MPSVPAKNARISPSKENEPPTCSTNQARTAWLHLCPCGAITGANLLRRPSKGEYHLPHGRRHPFFTKRATGFVGLGSGNLEAM